VKKKSLRKVGDVVQVPLGDGTYGFGLLLDEPLMAFFDLRLASGNPTPEQLAASRILFRVWVMNYAVTDGVWPVVGSMALPEEVLAPPEFFQKDMLNGRFYIWPHGGGDRRPATYEEVKDLECAAVWEAHHVESRLRDWFEGRPNGMTERFRAKPPKAEGRPLRDRAR